MKKLLAPLAALVLAAAAPEAAAQDPAAYGCRIVNASAGDATGEGVFEGVAAGYVVTGDSQGVWMRCYVEINGVEVATTPTGTGTGAAATAGEVSYYMAETDVVRLCIEGLWSNGYFNICDETILVDVPPQEVVDLIEEVADIVRPVCGSADLRECSNGICLVNVGTCDGGTCVVNTGYCGRDCIAVVNTGVCGRRPQVDPAGVGKPL